MISVVSELKHNFKAKLTIKNVKKILLYIVVSPTTPVFRVVLLHTEAGGESLFGANVYV